jgi:hypothetical protein
VFEASQSVSLRQVGQAVDGLYRTHPSIASYSVQDVQYPASARDTVLRECTSGSLEACAPLIFFLYEYGTQRAVPASVAAAGELYWYAAGHLAGARLRLDELLRSWKLPAPALTRAQARSALETALVTEAGDAMLAEKGVHLVITGTRPGASDPAERIVADVGTSTGTESIASGSASAKIVVTRDAAYYAGNQAGLTTLIGLPKAAASRAGSHWVMIRKGTREYQDLAVEDTIAALPGTLLPGSSDAVTLATRTSDGHKVYVLAWSATDSGTGTTITEKLLLTAGARALPVAEITTANGYRQTARFTNWGKPVTVHPPEHSP